MQPRLRLFGAVAWSYRGRVEPVRGRTRIGILLALAERQGKAVSVSSLLDRFWLEAPASGSNAVQRHVSGLRGQLAGMGHDNPGEVIEHVPGGYRLAESVASDLSDPGSGEWWLEPIVAASWEPHLALRTHLHRLAVSELQDFLSAEDVDAEVATDRCASLLHHVPDVGVVAEAVAEALSKVDDLDRAEQLAKWLVGLLGDAPPELHGRLRAFLPDESAGAAIASSKEARNHLRQVIGLWGVGRVDEALDRLEGERVLSEDLHRRLVRALIWQSPDDGGIRLQLESLPEGAVVDDTQSERALVSFDANTLNLMPDGAALSQDEISSAPSPPIRLRSLRVEFMRRLGEPRSFDDDAVVDQITELDLPDARVESIRFRFILSVRDGRWSDAKSKLAQYGETVAEYWPNTGDDFEPMAVASLQRALDEECRDVFAGTELRFGRFNADPWLLDVTEATRRLLHNDPSEPLTDIAFHRALGALRKPAARGLQLLRDMNSGRPVVEGAERMAADMSDMRLEKQFLYAPIALGRVAESLGRADIAAVAKETLEPWAGQILGLWPIDLVLGPADDWMNRFGAV